MKIPPSHPRYESLMRREKLVKGYKSGIVALEGLLAHGRGEAFDYLIGEKTIPPAERAERVAAAYLLRAKNPVLSVNGNAAVLGGKELVELGSAIPARMEVNLFHRTEERVRRVVRYLHALGAKDVLGPKANARLPGLDQPRSLCSSEGVFSSDVVLVPLEDGDRTEALVKMGKVVISVDLNPLSRTSVAATVSIVDEVTRAFQNLTRHIEELKERKSSLEEIVRDFDNRRNLRETMAHIQNRLNAEFSATAI